MNWRAEGDGFMTFPSCVLRWRGDRGGAEWLPRRRHLPGRRREGGCRRRQWRWRSRVLGLSEGCVLEVGESDAQGVRVWCAKGVRRRRRGRRCVFRGVGGTRKFSRENRKWRFVGAER